MPDTRPNHVSPSPKKRAFNCPHCHAFAQQHWYEVLGNSLHARTPNLVTEHDVVKARTAWVKDSSDVGSFQEFSSLERLATRRPGVARAVQRTAHTVENVFLACCQKCVGLSIWIYDRIIWPRQSTAPPPNEDLPDNVRDLYVEALTLVEESPRGATALLRLGIQMLCTHLGQPGKNINTDIGNLVNEGLDRRVQMALDVVRVVGNNAVHPGQIDMSDNIEIATRLFDLVNLIADRMITQPRRVEEMYNALPESALDAIKRRDNE